ncbi:MAG: amino acid transport protein [Pseudomonadales bacterium]|nr:amino acid transport protein [Pseudomonadales bacterium]MCP5358272.1 hypothetical protein [Pseudomonadales bacterium]
MDSSYLLWTVLFSSVGMGYFVYGKKQQHKSALLAGIGLMIYPYFVSSVLPLVLIGLVLMIAPRYLQL